MYFMWYTSNFQWTINGDLVWHGKLFATGMTFNQNAGYTIATELELNGKWKDTAI